MLFAMEVSNESKKTARQFAEENGLSAEAEEKLALLLEKAWQEGCAAEQVFAFTDKIADHIRKYGPQ